MKPDFIIAGQGLAGSLLAWFLLKQGSTILVVDDGFQASSSRVAAGIIHPITGRRLVKTWQADTLIPFAFNCYREMESTLDSKFFNEVGILETFTSIQHRNDWMARSADQEFINYVDRFVDTDEISKAIKAIYGGVLLKQTGWLDVCEFINSINKYLQQQNLFISEKVEINDIKFNSSSISWKDTECKHLVLCDGYSSLTQHYFKHLPFIPAKGELLTVRCDDLNLSYILNQSAFVLPLHNKLSDKERNLYKVGSTFSWKDLSTQSTLEASEQLSQSLKKLINVDFEIVNQQAAIRPATKDRRPFLGTHPQYKNISIFNGFGSKGVLLAPLYASEMAEYLLTGKRLDKEVNINRFI